MDHDLIEGLIGMGYVDVGSVSEPGFGVVKATYENEAGQSVDVYHRKFTPRS